MQNRKYVAAALGGVTALLLFSPQAMACYCANKSGGGFICEDHCSPAEIETKLGAGHGPVELVNGVLGADNLTGVTAAPAEASNGCYSSSTGDYVCPQGATTGTSAAKPGIGAPVPQQTVSNPVATGGTGGTATTASQGSPLVNSGNAATAYEWPPGFGCTGPEGLVGAPPVGQNPAEWGLTFEDEFNALDTNLWDDEWTSPKGQDNTRIEGGILKIFPIPGADLSRNYKHLKTDDVFEQTYGYFEAEMKLPVGKGTWPAFWLYQNNGPADWRPEMDIMEAYSGGGPDSGWSDANLHPTTFAPTVWRGSPGDMAGSKMITPGMDLSADFHTYAVKWEPDKQTYYFDGQPVYELNISMSEPMFLALSLQFGSASGPGDGSTPTGTGNAFEVKYVRAWSACK